ncbi:urease accessory protein UreH [Cytobacillus sp. NCCP-133]|uniref:urease accessory protein UreH n=1 Tax=Cytobacillus sp. NCCP-133 TaxID=766848 RepID=UPI00222E25F4|nr:urease accessory protein UreH [Cytobacillus sp. NCCP-133]GLB61494.1 hydantoin utilization protein A [Cytobacillus sp. NCCP-133]
MLESGLLSILLLGFTLGIKHSTEPDHVIAVSTIASQTKRLLSSSLAGVFWGLGHTIMLLVIGVTVIALNQHIPEQMALSLELLVGTMLIYLGFAGFKNNQKYNSSKKQHFHKKSLIIGGIHGMAGSAALVLLTTAKAQTGMQAFLFILIFGAGTIIGMLLFTTILGLPFLISASGHKKIHLNLVRVSSAASILYGLIYLFEVGRNFFS